jgi:hypothetical protein
MTHFRLEMLGHSIALLLKQPQLFRNTEVETPSENKIIAIIAPATSKGIHPDRLDQLAIVKSLIPSLYRTRSK